MTRWLTNLKEGRRIRHKGLSLRLESHARFLEQLSANVLAASEVEQLSANVAEKKKRVKEGIHLLEENTQLLLSVNELDRELREEEIEQGGVKTRLRTIKEERSKEKERRLATIAN